MKVGEIKCLCAEATIYKSKETSYAAARVLRKQSAPNGRHGSLILGCFFTRLRAEILSCLTNLVPTSCHKTAQTKCHTRSDTAFQIIAIQAKKNVKGHKSELKNSVRFFVTLCLACRS